ncbi:MAG: hypothetical protein AAF772_15080 [Acidobacteriota bacterium]
MSPPDVSPADDPSAAPPSAPDVLTADPRLRAVAMVAVVVFAALGFAGLSWLQAEAALIQQMAQQEPLRAIARFQHATLRFVIVPSLLLALTAVWMMRLALRARRADAYPPPGTRVVRDTPIVRGPAARRKAGFGLALGALALTLALATPIAVDVLLDRFADGIQERIRAAEAWSAAAGDER